MKQRPLITPADLKKAAADLLNLEANLPMVMTLTAGSKIRSSAANSRHWCNIRMFLDDIRYAVESVSEHTGYTPIETMRVLSKNLEPEQAAILCARKPEVAHEILKFICGIPTSTKLGSKDFQKFELILEQTIAEIIGSIKAVAREAVS